ncbi:MAG TPA: hypothetical protein VJ932_08590, partial [Alkalispirochaeta sp.]|nr:hypothetical protein [Alkalispirochaeta sp.]
MSTVQRYLENFKLTCPLQYDQPMREFTTFRVGGPADVLARPQTEAELQEVLAATSRGGTAEDGPVPVWVLGGGANIVVSDAGIRGVVV